MSDAINTTVLAEKAVVEIEERIGVLATAKRTAVLTWVKNALDGVVTTIYQQGYDEGYRVAKGQYDMKLAEIKKAIEGLNG